MNDNYEMGENSSALHIFLWQWVEKLFQNMTNTPLSYNILKTFSFLIFLLIYYKFIK